jgi:type II secretory ATPase GspE/PulE/Tfp pilus assembly ATPase PilB-like protein
MVDETFNGIRARLRIATAPASPNGFDMVIRILRFSEKSSYTMLTELGYSEEQATAIYSFSSDPVGVTIIAGTTGSGKSTTLKNILTKKIMDHNATLKVITVEDPPEYEIPNATQIPVIRDDSGSAEAGFSGAIRTAMRSDPDVLMIGEVRDSQSASLLVSATQSGHQVLSTLHAPSAVGIIPRLESLGISRDVLSASDFISGLIYQKLLPKLCPGCAIPHKNMDGTINSVISEEDVISAMNICSRDDISRVRDIDRNTPLSRRLQDIGILSEHQVCSVSKEYNTKLAAFEKTGFAKRLSKALKGRLMGVMHKGSGCATCGGSGIAGRLVVAELLIPNETILKAIRSGDDLATLKAWRESRFGQSILLSSLDKIADGIVDPMHVEAEIGALDG